MSALKIIPYYCVYIGNYLCLVLGLPCPQFSMDQVEILPGATQDTYSTIHQI